MTENIKIDNILFPYEYEHVNIGYLKDELDRLLYDEYGGQAKIGAIIGLRIRMLKLLYPSRKTTFEKIEEYFVDYCTRVCKQVCELQNRELVEESDIHRAAYAWTFHDYDLLSVLGVNYIEEGYDENHEWFNEENEEDEWFKIHSQINIPKIN